FGEVVAVDDVELTIRDGEFFSMLGPSGSGKTTVLRLIAGFETPTAGAVLLGGRDVSAQPPYDRDVNTVFQDYALFPHMSVQENIEYGLKVKKVGRDERRRRALAALETVRLGGLHKRRPNQLSGGQRQRVALARALVNRPKVLLLDEPLGALDLKLREEMQIELKAIQHEVGITFVFVTHDQHEALSMSDRIAVFNHGRVEQVGTPRQIYERPATSFVAAFVGTTNLLRGDVAARVIGRPGTFAIRPERISLGPVGVDAPGATHNVEGTVTDLQYLGAEGRVRVRAEGDLVLVAAVPGAAMDGIAGQEQVRVSWPESAVFDVADTELLATDPAAEQREPPL
ncbi:MAG: ABC transporter ATP-binding protein, partial [Chloroflexi bacterium]|nr:ABC transporter ATP-binding protein [Chloroflexota bacterium]